MIGFGFSTGIGATTEPSLVEGVFVTDSCCVAAGGISSLFDLTANVGITESNSGTVGGIGSVAAASGTCDPRTADPECIVGIDVQPEIKPASNTKA